MMWLDAKHCPHCGAPGRPIAVGELTGRSCPRCQTPLHEIGFAFAAGEECAGCHGLWIHPADFDRLCSDAEARSAASGLAPNPPSDADPLAFYPPCPECAQPMSRQNYMRRSGVMINLCRAHGVWLDAGELRRVMDFIYSGGLDRMRREELDRLNEARRRLEATQRDTTLADSRDDNTLRRLFDLF